MRFRVTVLFSLSLLGGCALVRWDPLYGDLPAQSEDDPSLIAAREAESKFLPQMFKRPVGATRHQIESPWARIALFPVNLVASITSNVLVGFVSSARGCLFPAPYYAVAGLVYYGPRDAWNGYVFWEPSSSEAFAEWWGIGPVFP